MVDAPAFVARTAFAGLLAPTGPAPAGVRVVERTGLGVAMVQARKGAADALAARALELHGVAPPREPRRVAGCLEWLGVGRDRWLALSRADADFVDDLAANLDGLASVIDQSEGFGVLAISGPRARDAFAKGLPIDLHPSAFAPDAVASSMIAHVAVTIWRVGDDEFEVAVARSFAVDFARWLMESAAEFGLRL